MRINHNIMLSIVAVTFVVAAAIGGSMLINSESNQQNPNANVSKAGDYTPEAVINDVDIESLMVLSDHDFYDVTDHVYVGDVAEAEKRAAEGHNVIQLPIYSSEYVFFMDTGERAGDTWTKAIMEAEGMKCIAFVLTETFFPYSTAPESFWTIEDGHFVKLHPESDITLLNNLYSQLSAKKGELAKTDYQFQMYVDGVLTEEQYAPTKALRVQLYSEISSIQSQIDELLK